MRVSFNHSGMESWLHSNQTIAISEGLKTADAPPREGHFYAQIRPFRPVSASLGCPECGEPWGSKGLKVGKGG
jgi:hypothetical protein